MDESLWELVGRKIFIAEKKGKSIFIMGMGTWQLMEGGNWNKSLLENEP